MEKLWILTLTVVHLALLQSSAYAANPRTFVPKAERVRAGDPLTALDEEK